MDSDPARYSALLHTDSFESIALGLNGSGHSLFRSFDVSHPVHVLVVAGHT